MYVPEVVFLPLLAGFAPPPGQQAAVAGNGNAVALLRQWFDHAQGLKRPCAAALAKSGENGPRDPPGVRPATYDVAAREHPCLRPSARPLRVLAARRRVQDRGPRRARRRVRPAGHRPDRPRRHERRGRAVQGRRKHGVKPILGCEIYLVDDHAAKPGPGQRVERNHLTLLAQTDEGYRNLVKLSCAGFLEGLQRGKPSVDMGLLAEHAEGIIALTGCLASRFAARLVDDRVAEARAHLDDLIQVFGPEDVYFEVQKNGIALQDKVNEGIVRLARELGRPLVGTGDVHYLRREDYHHHAALLCVQTKSTLAEPKMSFDTNEFFLKSSEEMAARLRRVARGDRHDAGDRRALRRDDRARPAADPALPDADGRGRGRATCATLVEEGLRERYGAPPPAAAIERMEFELGVIDKMGFNAYFLIVWDFVDWAKDNGIAVGPGRGSAAGSIVAYCLRITDVDPLRYDLLFERFLNPERVSMPDIDIDFSVRGRERVMRYVTEKYGPDRVAQIVTFGKMFPRAATRDAARVLGHDYGAGDRLAKLIPDPQQGRPPSFEDCLAPGSELRDGLRRRPDGQADRRRRQGPRGHRPQLLDPRGRGRHRRPAADRHRAAAARRRGHRAPTARRSTGRSRSSRMKPVEELGLLKMDFLGLRNLDVIEDALDIIERSTGERPDMARAAARRREDLRDARPRRLGRRLPVRVRGHAGGAARRSSRPSSTTSSRSWRSTARAPWTRSRPTRAASATPTRSPSPTSAWSRSSARPTA